MSTQNVPVLSTRSIGGKQSFAVRPKGKVWASADNVLVKDGDENAVVMVSNGADTLSLHEAQKYPNYREYFEPVNSQDSFPPAEDAEEVAIRDAVAPRRGRPSKLSDAA